MAQIIGLPKLSPTMEEGVLVKWVKKEGDAVEPGDLIAEVETDKANMDFNLEDEGVLLKLLVKEGDTVKLGAPVAILGEAGEDVSALVAQAKGGAGDGAKAAAKPASPEKRPAPAEVAGGAAEAPERVAAVGPAVTTSPTTTPTSRVSSPSRSTITEAPTSTPRTTSTSTLGGKAGKFLASPLAKTLAIELGVDLRTIRGTGPGGRIIERDVRHAAGGGAVAEAVPEVEVEDLGSTALTVIAPGPIARPGESDEYVDKPLSGVRKTIAARLTAAKQDAPHFRVTTSFDAARLMDFRSRLNDLLGDRGKVSVNDLIVKGAALALRRVPEVNVAFMGEAIRYFTRVHIGVAVALERGLLTPVVRNADLKGIGVISAEIKDLVQRAKNRELKAHEISGSTFTVSNLGMFGVDHFDAIINPPEAAILAVGRLTKQPVVVDDEIVIGQRMTLTLSCDHRAVDGALGARYLDQLVEILERPESLAL